VLGAFFDAYDRDQPDGAMSLMEWVETRYDPELVTDGYQPLRIGVFVTDNLLRRE
jgi:hypothetical protein